MSQKLFVRNVATEATSTEGSDLFSTVGKVASCHLIPAHRTSGHKGVGFVEIDSDKLAQAAKTRLNIQALHGQTLKVDISWPCES